MSTGSPSPFATPAPAPAPSSGSSTKMILLIVLGAVMVTMLFCGGIMVALLLPAVQAARQAARQAQSANQLKQIGLALHNYHSVHNMLPPAYATDTSGNPTVSWRVLILPYLEESQLYDQFDLSQPWNSAVNLPLADRMPMLYSSPVHANVPPGHTSYVAVRSPQSLFPGDQPVVFSDVTDGLSNTVAVIDMPNQAVLWTAPDDSSPSQFYAVFTASTTAIPAVFGDGAVTRLSPDTPQATLDAIVTRDGNETITMP